jgi:lipoyl-dependent peroxiredoxin
MADIRYSTTSTAWGGRQGRVTSSDDRLDLNLSRPAGIGGDDGPGTNPEQLFSAGYAACFHSALVGVGRMRRIDLAEAVVSVTVGLDRVADGFVLRTRIEAQLPGIAREVAQELIEAADAMCPYSRATRGNIVSEVVLVEDGD